MNYLATIKLDSPTDKDWKSAGSKTRTIYRNKFTLRKDVYLCKNIINLLPLLRHDDVEVLMSGLTIKLEG